MHASHEELRQRIVQEALSFVGTPYHLGGRVKGAGVDCATLVFLTYLHCGLIPNEDLGVFQHDWYCHAKEETYLMRILRHAYKTAEAVTFRSMTEAKPGDIVLVKAARSRLYNHGGIVIRWPRIVHAITPKVQETDASTCPMWANKTVLIFSPKACQEPPAE